MKLFRKTKRKNLLLFIIYFIVIFYIIDSSLCKILGNYFHYSQEYDIPFLSTQSQQINLNSLLVNASYIPSICDNIEGIEVENEFITVKYSKSIPLSNNEEILSFLSHFSLDSSWLDQEIFFPLNSAQYVTSNDSTVTFTFFMPVIDTYDCSLICISPKHSLSQYFRESRNKAIDSPDHRLNFHNIRQFFKQKKKLIANIGIKIYDIKINAQNFTDDENINGYSRLKCHNKNHFETRWCEFRNIGYFNNHFFFFSPGEFSFPQPFIVPGPRAPPFDKEVDRFVVEPIVLTSNPAQIPIKLEPVTDFCYIYGVFHNYHMLWHALFDFMIPLYQFIKQRNGTDTKFNRRVYVKSDGTWTFDPLMKIFSYLPVTIICEENFAILMYRGTIGIEKPEENPSADRPYDISLTFKYNFNRSTALGMREDVLHELYIPDNIYMENGRHNIVFVDRGNDQRTIVNTDEIIDLMKKTCSFCNIHRVKFQDMSITQQVRLVSKSSVLIGYHGSGLSHVVWMAESLPNRTTHMIEIMPYKYTCRNWYHIAANVAGVEYHQVINKNPPKNVNDENLKYCWNNPSLCSSVFCHDLIRDQPVALEIDTFNKTWSEVVEKLRISLPN